MEESRRRAYLERLGVSLWWSKAPLPGALPSTISFAEKMGACGAETERALAAPFSQEKRAEAKYTEVNSTDAKSQRSAISQSLAPLAQKNQKTEVPASAISPTKNATSREQKSALPSLNLPPFAFCKIQLQNGFLLLVELSDVTAPGLSADESRLLAAILLSIRTDTLNERGFGAHQVKWPFKVGQEQFATLEAARDFMHAYLAAEYQRSRFGGLLFLGDTLTKLCSEDSLESSMMSKDLRVIANVSLTTLLEHPHKKAVLWQQIKFLRATCEYEQP